MKKFFKKEYIFIIFVFAFVLSTILINPLGDLDEIWNYNVARNIAKGLIPYKDISTITTPFLPMLNSLFLKFFADELIVMRVLASALITAIVYTIYKILKKVTGESNISIIAAFMFLLLLRKNYCIDYNYMTLFLAFLLAYLELRNNSSIRNKDETRLENNKTKNNKKEIDKKEIVHEILQGVLAGLAVCTKQSVGFFIAIATVIFPVTQRSTLKKMGLRISGMAIPGILLIIYFTVTDAWSEFFSYAVKGISTFSNSIPYKMLYKENNIIEVLARTLPVVIVFIIIITIIFLIKNYKSRKVDCEDMKEKDEDVDVDELSKKATTNYFNKYKFQKNIIILTIYSLPMLIVIYPIADKIHFLIGSLMVWVEFTYIVLYFFKTILSKIVDKIINKTKTNKLNELEIENEETRVKSVVRYIYKSMTIIICIVFVDVIVSGICQNVMLYNKEDINKEISHYKGIEVPNNLKERIAAIEEFTNRMKKENKKVYILDAEAAVYNIPLDVYIKNYDMFLKGNIGKYGEDGIIEQIKNDEDNVVYLIKQEGYALNWQTPTKVIEYVRNNMKELEKVDIFVAMEK